MSSAQLPAFPSEEKFPAETEGVKGIPSSSGKKPDIDIVALIHAAAPERESLLATLTSTEHAALDLSQLKLKITNLANRLFDASQLCSELSNKVEIEKKEHESMQKSHGKKFLASMTGKKKEFEKQAEKEEADWVSAEKWYKQSQAALQALEKEEGELKKARSALEKKVQKHLDAQNSLDSLYDKVFMGPSPGFAEEDALEAAVAEAQLVLSGAQNDVEEVMRVYTAIQEVNHKLVAAIDAIDMALRASKQDMRGTMSTHAHPHSLGEPSDGIADSMERSALKRARAYVAEARVAFRAAQELDPEIMIREQRTETLDGGGDVFGWEGVVDVVFDNWAIDWVFEEKIRDMREEVEGFREGVMVWVEKWEGIVQGKREVVSEKRVDLEKARGSLLDGRREAFARVIGEEAPRYEAILRPGKRVSETRHP